MDTHEARDFRSPLNSYVQEPFRRRAAGTTPKIIEEFVGRSSTGTTNASVARMRSPAGWSEPGQTPEFDEVTVVLGGTLLVDHRDGTIVVQAGEAIHTPAGTWVRYSTPQGAEYLAVCTPAFADDQVHRDEHST